MGSVPKREQAKIGVCMDLNKKTEMLVKGESLNWGKKETPCCIEKRAQHALAEWSSYWQGKEGHERKQQGTPLRAITAYRIKKVPKRMSPHKAKGLDHWGPDKLKELPHTYLEGLTDILDMAEKKRRMATGTQTGVGSIKSKTRSGT